MKLKKGGDGKWLYGTVITESAMVDIKFYPFTIFFEFIESSPYRRRLVTISCGGIEKFKAGKGQRHHWKKSVFEVLGENKSEGAGDEINQ